MPPNPNKSLTVVSDASEAVFPLFSAIYGTVGILISLGIALSMGHVHVWPPPYISDCGIHPPESYIFRFCLVSMGILICRMSYIAYDYIKAHTAPDANDLKNWKMALASGVFLSGVGCIDCAENKYLHLTCALLFFINSVYYMRAITPRFKAINVHPTEDIQDSQTKRDKLVRVCSILAAIVIAARVLQMVTGTVDYGYHYHGHRHPHHHGIGHGHHHGIGHGHHHGIGHGRHHEAPAYDPRRPEPSLHHGYHAYEHPQGHSSIFRTILVFIEWTLTLFIIIFYATFAPDFKKDSFSTGTFVPVQNPASQATQPTQQ